MANKTVCDVCGNEIGENQGAHHANYIHVMKATRWSQIDDRQPDEHGDYPDDIGYALSAERVDICSPLCLKRFAEVEYFKATDEDEPQVGEVVEVTESEG